MVGGWARRSVGGVKATSVIYIYIYINNNKDLGPRLTSVFIFADMEIVISVSVSMSCEPYIFCETREYQAEIYPK